MARTKEELEEIFEKRDIHKLYLGIYGYAYLSQRIVEEFSLMTNNAELNMSGLIDQYEQLQDVVREKLETKVGYFIEAKDLFYSINKSENKVDLLKQAWQAFQKNNILLSNIFNWQIDILEEYLREGKEEKIETHINFVGSNVRHHVLNFNQEPITTLAWLKKHLSYISVYDDYKTKSNLEDDMNKLIAELLTLDEHPDSFTIYDGALGKGDEMLELKKLLPDKAIKFYGQEVEENYVEAAKLNYLVHDVHPDNFKFISGDTLTDDKFSEDLKFDNVVMDMPFSRKWGDNLIKEDDSIYQIVSDLPPKTKPDYAFILRGLLHLKDSGTMVAVVPQGALLRGSREAKIREQLIKLNYLDAVINFPIESDKTASSRSLLVFKKKRTNKDIMFINAEGYVDNIDSKKVREKIITTYKKRENVTRLASVVSPEEIAKNEYNLFYSRYIDMFKEKPMLSLKKEKAEVEELRIQSKQNGQELANLLQDLTQDTDIKSEQIIDMILK